ncbi:carboxylesterase/lipase family protein [Pseudonocardia parietis]|uniref:Carboxylic ester hydrolase n=1 Tax=Pseudonocardia parietis TaxID=570936 RepID=A0ABS4VPW1_9PSEU|nr:carboxylesterase family protein [Pseudonocardia parietis]MBP2365960.1 para-nitrobenzyl esterase [Pseudonocardia parietis]
MAAAGLGAAAMTSAPAEAGGTTHGDVVGTARGDVVGTTLGDVRGTVENGVRSFQGIPYAAAPVGERRWRPPRPAAPWPGVREATSPGPACAQPVGYPIGVPSENEDCLHLNVTAPVDARGDLPVIVWIHGGSLMYGTGDLYGPDRMAAGGAVVVSMNYRLGVMGFLADPALGESGGLGLEDQQAALRWVRANAAAFGGDARNVTVMGESGGGYAVCGHLASPGSAGLFDRAIVQSAPCATGSSRTPQEARAESARVIEATGCDEDTAACLRGRSAAELMAAYGTSAEPRPVSGTRLLPVAPEEALRTGRFNRVPVLIGVNHGEERGMVLGEELATGQPLRPEEYEPAVRERFGARADAVLERYPLSAYPSAGEALAAAGTDSAWSAPTLETAELLARWTPTRMYEFAEVDTPWYEGFPEPSFPVGAQHMSELAYLFDLELFEARTPAQDRLADRMIEAWVRFADSGETDWPAFRDDGHEPYVQSLTSGTWQRTEFVEDHRYDFWKSVG